MFLLVRTVFLSIKNILANKKRNFLSILTVILGSFAISTVLTVNENVSIYVDHLISKNGGANLFLNREERNAQFSAKQINDLKNLPGSRYLILDSQVPVVLRHGKNNFMTSVTLYSDDYTKARPLKLQQGQLFSDVDKYHLAQNIVVSPYIVKKLKLDDPLGAILNVSLGGRRLLFKIIGVALPQFSQEDRGITWVTQRFFEQLTLSKFHSALILGTTSYGNLYDFENSVQQYLGANHIGNIDLYNPKDYFDEMKSDYGTFIQVGGVIGFLALIGGAVGVMNLMLLSIQLRTKEIGLYKALGFSTGLVLSVFILESLFTINIGGAIGSVIGCLFGYLISSGLVTTPPVLSVTAFMIALVTSFVVGLVFSYFPALKAARLETVEALKT